MGATTVLPPKNQQVGLCIEMLRRGTDSAAEIANEAIRRGMVPIGASRNTVLRAFDRALKIARQEGFRRIGPASIGDARGALELYGREMLEMARLARVEKRYTESESCYGKYLRAHGVRIDEDIESVSALLGSTNRPAEDAAAIRAKLSKLQEVLGPRDAVAFVGLLARLDAAAGKAPPSEAWHSNSTPDVPASSTVLDSRSLLDTGEPSGAEVHTAATAEAEPAAYDPSVWEGSE